MFELVGCTIDNCRIPAVTGSETCMLHSKNRPALTRRIAKQIAEHEVFAGQSASYIELENLAINDKRLHATGLSHGIFKNIDFSRSSFRLIFFDFCEFTNCLFREVDMKYTVFAGSTLTSCDFSSSDILHCNFNGITAHTCVFNESDLYFSTFAHSSFTDTNFIDCNLKKVRLNDTKRNNVSFKYSNYEEAFFGESAEL
jgi:uncharacterized protein YjbI with pentapeptide repeats